MGTQTRRAGRWQGRPGAAAVHCEACELVLSLVRGPRGSSSVAPSRGPAQPEHGGVLEGTEARVEPACTAAAATIPARSQGLDVSDFPDEPDEPDQDAHDRATTTRSSDASSAGRKVEHQVGDQPDGPRRRAPTERRDHHRRRGSRTSLAPPARAGQPPRPLCLLCSGASPPRPLASSAPACLEAPTRPGRRRMISIKELAIARPDSRAL